MAPSSGSVAQEYSDWQKYMAWRDVQPNRMTPERLADLQICDTLLPRERTLLEEILIKHDKAFACSEQEKGKMNPTVIPPVEIRTVQHDGWKYAAPKYNERDEREITANCSRVRYAVGNSKDVMDRTPTAGLCSANAVVPCASYKIFRI